MSRRRSQKAIVACTVLFILGGCERQSKEGAGGARATSTSSAVDVVVNLDADGRASVGGEPVTMEHLRRRLVERAGQCPSGTDGLPVSSVEVSAHPECEYRRVQDVMLQCMKIYVWRITWEMGGRRLNANLPADAEHDMENPVFVHEEVEGPDAAAAPLRTVDGRSDNELPPRIRVRIYWANAETLMIGRPSEGVPPALAGRVERSTEGAHIRMTVNLERYGGLPTVDRTRCADLDELGRTLAEFVGDRRDSIAVIEARQKVPFRWVFGAVEACHEVGIEHVRFQAPPVEGAGGDDWWNR